MELSPDPSAWNPNLVFSPQWALGWGLITRSNSDKLRLNKVLEDAFHRANAGPWSGITMDEVAAHIRGVNQMSPNVPQDCPLVLNTQAHILDNVINPAELIAVHALFNGFPHDDILSTLDWVGMSHIWQEFERPEESEFWAPHLTPREGPTPGVGVRSGPESRVVVKSNERTSGTREEDQLPVERDHRAFVKAEGHSPMAQYVKRRCTILRQTSASSCRSATISCDRSATVSNTQAPHVHARSPNLINDPLGPLASSDARALRRENRALRADNRRLRRLCNVAREANRKALWTGQFRSLMKGMPSHSPPAWRRRALRIFLQK